MRLPAIALALLLFPQARPPAPVNARIDGEWRWTGPAGWQRIRLDLKANGSKLTGTLVMGPGSRNAGPLEDWERFFHPVVLQISNGAIRDGAISFEHSTGFVRTERMRYAGTFDGDRLVLSRETQAGPDEPFAIGYHKTSFTMTRVGAPELAAKPDAVSPATTPSTSPTVSMDVLVTDSAGRAVEGLGAADFVVLENGSPRPISRLAIPSTPVSVQLLFDHNLTWLEDNGRATRSYVTDTWTALLQSVARFLNGIRKVDRLSLGIFEDKVQLVENWQTNERKVNVPLGAVALAPEGQRNVYGALAWLQGRFAAAPGRKIAVVFTDGRDGRLSPRWLRDSEGHDILDPLFGLEDVGERAEFEKTLNAARQSGIRLYFIAVNTGHDPEFGPAIVGRRISGLYPGASEEIEAYLVRVRRRLEALAEGTGGRVLYGNTPRDAVSLYNELGDELGIGRTYTLDFVSAKDADGAIRNIEVRVAREGVRVMPFQRFR